ncbi:MAG: hypothetical protein SVK08_00365 [Halobacteriota archaeon]|nr:hypothetical protein [Halobacteriota archaeon]
MYEQLNAVRAKVLQQFVDFRIEVERILPPGTEIRVIAKQMKYPAYYIVQSVDTIRFGEVSVRMKTTNMRGELFMRVDTLLESMERAAEFDREHGL